MTTSTYDQCLLVTQKEGAFGIAGLQIDDTLMAGDKAFLEKEEIELKKAGFDAKEIIELSKDKPFSFNGCKVSLSNDGIYLQQNGQLDKLKLVDTKAGNVHLEYVPQRARGAYVSSVCQPEAARDLSVAAQHPQPTSKDAENLNERLQWQIDNKERGLCMIPIYLPKAKLYIFVDASFANNADLTSQLGYVIVLGTEEV